MVKEIESKNDRGLTVREENRKDQTSVCLLCTISQNKMSHLIQSQDIQMVFYLTKNIKC